jgi:hypothetical protein
MSFANHHRLVQSKKGGSTAPKAGRRLGQTVRQLKAWSAAKGHSPAVASAHHEAMLERFRTRG